MHKLLDIKCLRIRKEDVTFYVSTFPLEGEIHKFYPDRISGTCVGTMAFSPIEVRKDERIVKMAE
ncbi:hypothetical protein ACQRDF_08730 [Lachnospiraceae bacterium SGI.054]